MFKWLRNIVKPKSDLDKAKKPILERSRYYQKSNSVKPKTRGRPRGIPTETMTIKIPLGLRKDFRAACDKRDLTMSFVVAGFMQKVVAEHKVSEYQAYTSIRHKPRRKKA